MVARKGHGGLSQNRKRRVIGEDHAEKRQRRRAERFHRHANPWSILLPYFQVTRGRLRTGMRRYLNLGYPIIIAPKAR